MPEGDTIYRTATRLRSALVDRRIDAATDPNSSVESDKLVGRTVTAVEAKGKHLLVHFDDGSAVHSHLGMTGSWHVYQKGERWRKPSHRAALALEAADTVCVCFSPKTLELLTATGLRRHPYLRRLGPDVLRDRLDERQIIDRFRVHDQTPIGEAVMNQSIVCGIGNVYKSETLFLTRIHPFTLVGQLSDDEIVAVVQNARTLMSKNLQGRPRRTRIRGDGPRMWVYGRNGGPCFECGERIKSRRQGDLGRITFWCPRCQPGRSSVNA